MSETIRGYGQKLSYGEALQKRLEQLHISQEELAKAVGVTPRTISRYVQEDTRPCKETRQAIAAFIADKSTFGAYEFMVPEKFVPLLNSLLKEFKGEVTQRTLASAIGIHQKNISHYTCLSDTDKPNTQTQYAILNYFRNQCYQNGLLNGGHFSTAVYLEQLILGERGGNACFWEQFHEIHGVTEERGPFYAYALSLPQKLRDLILEHFVLFYDDLTPHCVMEYEQSYYPHTLSCGIRLFRRMTEEQRTQLVKKLEGDTFIGFPPKGFGTPDISWYSRIYKHLAGFYQIIPLNLQKMRQFEDKVSLNKSKESEYIKRIEDVLTWNSDRLLVQNNIIKEIEFKLTMTSYEWYVAMLLYIYYFKHEDLDSLYDDMARQTNCIRMSEEEIMEQFIMAEYQRALEQGPDWMDELEE